MYEISLEQFKGPLDKLLELIEAKQMEITKVNLAAVTEDFIKYVEGLGQNVEPIILADFVVVASRLLLIKSKVLLPSFELTDEEEQEIGDLEHRLKIYREFSARGASALGGKTAAQIIIELWGKNQIEFARPLFASLGEQSFFYPSKEIGAQQLANAMRNLMTVLQGLLPETKKIKIKVVTLQEKIAELATRLEQAASVTFNDLSQKKARVEVIVLFLAVLHMLANRLMTAEQEDSFGDIVVKKNGAPPSDARFAMGIPTA